MYLGDYVEILNEQLTTLDRSDSFVLRPVVNWTSTDGKLVQTKPMQSSYFHNIYKSIRQRVFSNKDNKVLWNNNNNYLPRSLVGFLQVFSDKTASTFRRSGFFAYQPSDSDYPIHVKFLNSSPS